MKKIQDIPTEIINCTENWGAKSTNSNINTSLQVETEAEKLYVIIFR